MYGTSVSSGWMPIVCSGQCAHLFIDYIITDFVNPLSHNYFGASYIQILIS